MDKKKPVILIVDDNENNSLLLEIQILELNSNIEIIHAIDGDYAVDICKSRADIDLVLMDINMPNMNGYDATKLIKDVYPDLPIVYQTAYAFKDSFLEAASSGGSNFITKPIDSDTLDLVLSRYLKN